MHSCECTNCAIID